MNEQFQRITHQQLIQILKEKGVNCVHITRKMAYIVGPVRERYWWPDFVPNMDHLIDKTKIPMDDKIQAIKAVRTMTVMGLKDAKDFVERNFPDCHIRPLDQNTLSATFPGQPLLQGRRKRRTGSVSLRDSNPEISR